MGSPNWNVVRSLENCKEILHFFCRDALKKPSHQALLDFTLYPTCKKKILYLCDLVHFFLLMLLTILNKSSSPSLMLKIPPDVTKKNQFIYTAIHVVDINQFFF